ncbi:MAG: hypothetical protein PHU21_08970 [Elusimicrobia bacterium]|nr:hypothetical protein [Elusimicrobiota bacterium]
MESAPVLPEKTPSKPWAFTVAFSWDGPGLPTRSQSVEFLRSLSRRDLAIVGGVVAFIFVIEPLLLYWLFSARLKSGLDEGVAELRAAVASQIQAEVGPAMKESLSQQLRLVTPLSTSNASDSTGLVVPSPAAAPPPPAKSK